VSRPDDNDSRAARAQAAAWLARLRSEERTAADERGFRTWLAEDAHNRQAFETANAIFEMVGAADRDRLASLTPHRVSRRTMLQASMTVAAASVFGVAIYLRSGTTYATEVGEQRTVSLADGTLVSLDTNTEIRVWMHRTRRVVQLRRGRAHFDVADDSSRPFEVIAGDRSVITRGAHFDVSKDGVVVSVLHERGRPLTVGATEAAEDGGTRVSTARDLVEGERVVFAADKIMREDRPILANAVAWRYGRLAFFGEPLSQAVAEMNRYTRRPIVIADPEVGRMPISGNYSVGDTEAFATSLSVLLPVKVEPAPDRVTLRLRPAPARRAPAR
jgi:transmembrane sensor